MKIREHKFKHSFQNTINPSRSCSLELQLNSFFFLHCQNVITPTTNLMNELRDLDPNKVKQIKEKYKNKVKKKNIMNFILYKNLKLKVAIWKPTDVILFLDICLLTISLSFCLCKIYIFVYFFICVIALTWFDNEVLFLVCDCIISISILLLLTLYIPINIYSVVKK